MAAPVTLDIPQAKRKLWAQFSAALVQKAVAQDEDGMKAAFAVLLKHCADEAGVDVLRRLCDGEAADVATTILAYLPDAARKTISQRLKTDRAMRDQVLATIRDHQAAVREAVREVVRDNPGKYPGLRKVVA